MLIRALRSANRRIHFRKRRIRDKLHGIVDRVYFKDRKVISDTNHKVNFHCVAWGGLLDLYFAYTVPSLLQDGNIPALAKSGYNLKLSIYTHPEEYEVAAEKYGSQLDRLKEYLTIDVVHLKNLQVGWLQGNYWHSSIIHQIKRCIDENAIMFLTLPDYIFGNRSVANGVKTIEGKNAFLAASHARVSQDSILNSEAFNSLKRMERQIENDELVDLAFEHGNQFLLGFFDNEDANMTHGGVSIRKINSNTYSVINNAPSPFVGNYVKDDLKYFAATGSSWDNRWPRLLARQNRLKIVGSSESFFMVEVTPNDGRHLAAVQSGSLHNDKYLTKGRRLLHNYVSNSLCCVWKGRETISQDHQ